MANYTRLSPIYITLNNVKFWQILRLSIPEFLDDILHYMHSYLRFSPFPFLGLVYWFFDPSPPFLTH